jgi:cell division protein FtsI (penicillin-binding protein 3)
MRNKSLSLFVIVLCCTLFSCSKPSSSTIDKLAQAKADSLLFTELANSQADSGLIMVMSVKTGEIIARLKMKKDFSLGKFVAAPEGNLNAKDEPGPILIPLTVMAAMEEVNLSLDFQVDAGNGMYVSKGRTIYDQDVFGKGGYGVITLGQCVTNPSFIGTVKTLEVAFSGGAYLLENRMKKMSFGLPADTNVFYGVPEFTSKLDAFAVGYYCKTTPLQILTAYNAIANNGKIMAPKFVKGDDVVIDSAMCSERTINEMKALLKENGTRLIPEIPDVAAIKSFSSVKNTYKREIKYTCCGFFPASNPEYTCLVSLYRSESPNSDAAIGAAKVNDAGKKMFNQMTAFLIGSK